MVNIEDVVVQVRSIPTRVQVFHGNDGVDEIRYPNGMLLLSNEHGGEIYWKDVLRVLGVSVEDIYEVGFADEEGVN